MTFSTVSGKRRLRNSETLSPALEKTRSHGTDVAGIQNKYKEI